MSILATRDKQQATRIDPTHQHSNKRQATSNKRQATRIGPILVAGRLSLVARVRSRRGVSLIELLVTVIIGAIAMLALAQPFMAERIFWMSGEAEAESQRDAQLALRAMARMVRESSGYVAGTGFQTICSNGLDELRNTGDDVLGSIQFAKVSDNLEMTTCGAAPVVLIDGVASRSKVTDFQITTPTPTTTNLVRVQITVLHTRGSRSESETLNTEIFLRNG